jgi:hypothetical protein
MAGRENEADRILAVPSGSVAITPSDTTVISPVCHKIFLGNETAANTIKFRLLDGTTPTLVLAAGNTVIDLQFDMVFATGSTLANNPIGFYYI